MTSTESPDGVSARLRELTESVTLAITAKAKALRAAGEDVIGFGAGEPDYPTPAHIVAAAQQACADERMHRYTPAAGLPELREAIAAKTKRDSGLDVVAAQVLVTNGGKHALANAFQALIDPGDEVILPAPYWVSYPEQIVLAGGTVVPVATGVDDGFRASVEQLEAVRTDRTKALVFTSPSNPTGAVYPPDEVEAVGRWAAEHGIWVIADEIYEHLVFGDAEHVSMATAVPELSDRIVIANGVAKTYAMTGWRVGWTIAPLAVTKAMVNLQSHVTSNVANVAQVAALAAVAGPLDDVAMMRDAFERRGRHAATRLDAIEGIVCRQPEGAFYAFPSVEGVIGREIGGRTIGSSLELCEVLLDVAKVALVPGEGFGSPGYVRLSYAMSDQDIDTGLDRIAAALAT
jgi:aspartate/methionine/tyrosine aminotransferase